MNKQRELSDAIALIPSGATIMIFSGSPNYPQ
jgi:hypothetical protein